MNRMLTRAVAANLGLLLLGFTCENAVGQNWYTIDVEGEVRLPSGNPLVGGTVYVMPNDTRSHIRPRGTKTGTSTGADGKYKLNIDADGPIQLRFDGAISYKSLSHLSGGLKINCFMTSSPSQRKQNVILTITDAYEWGERWNEFIPEDSKGRPDVVLYQDGRIIVPKQFAVLFGPETDRDPDGRDIGKLGSGHLFIRPPRGTPDGKNGLGMDFGLRDVGNGQIERRPTLKFER